MFLLAKIGMLYFAIYNCVDATIRYVEILCFRHFFKHIVFTGEGDKIRNTVIKNYINVSVVVNIECEDTGK